MQRNETRGCFTRIQPYGLHSGYDAIAVWATPEPLAQPEYGEAAPVMTD